MSRMQSDFLSQFPNAQEMDDNEALQSIFRAIQFLSLLAIGAAVGISVISLVFTRPEDYVNWKLIFVVGTVGTVIFATSIFVLKILVDTWEALRVGAYEEIRNNVQENTREGMIALRKKVTELEEAAKATKRYNSVAVIAFTVEHDNYDEPTEEELRAGLVRRMELLDTEGPEGYIEAVAGDISDTCENLYDDDGNAYPGDQHITNEG